MVEGIGWRRVSGLKGFEFQVEQADVRVMTPEALLVSGRGVGAQTILLEGAVEGGLGLELLERVGGPAEGVGHDGRILSQDDRLLHVRERISV